jgi:hypothetical protein
MIFRDLIEPRCFPDLSRKNVSDIFSFLREFLIVAPCLSTKQVFKEGGGSSHLAAMSGFILDMTRGMTLGTI